MRTDINSIDDKNIVLAEVTRNGAYLEIVLEKFKTDFDIVLAAVTQNGQTLLYASPELQNDKTIVHAAISQNSWALVNASAELRNDYALVLEAVKHNGWLLEYASAELQNNKDIIWAAILLEGRALQYASLNLQNDIEILLTALYNDNDAADEIDENIIIKNKALVLFMDAHGYLISDTDWPLVLKALLEKPYHFLNPEPAIKALTDGMDYPYLVLAQYALSKNVIIAPEPYPEINL